MRENNSCYFCGKKIQVEFGDPVTYECEDKASTFFEDVKLNYFFYIPFLRGNLAVSSFFFQNRDRDSFQATCETTGNFSFPIADPKCVSSELAAVC